MRTLSVFAAAGVLAVGVATHTAAHVAAQDAIAPAPAITGFATPVPDVFGSMLVDR